MSAIKIARKENSTALIAEWAKEKIKITSSRLGEHQDGLKGEILIQSTNPKDGHIHQAAFNFSSSMTRKKLADDLSKRIAGIAWDEILEQLCFHVTKVFRTGQEVVMISSTDEEAIPPQYVVHPLILKKEINMIYGEGGVGKSALSLFLAAIGSCFGDWVNIGHKLGLERIQPFKTLVLDWETHQDAVRWRWKQIISGIGATGEGFFIEYRQCGVPLADDLEAIQTAISDKKPGLVIIDSVGAAAGGDINTQQVATEFMNAVRALDITTLLIHHTAKSNNGKPTPFGSVYFTNASRNIWQIERTQKEADNKIQVGLFHVKANYSEKFNPIGLEIEFSDTATKFSSVDPKDIPDFKEKLPVIQRIMLAIEEKNGAASKDEIGAITSLPEDVVLNVLKGNNLVFVGSKNDIWRLVK